MSGFFRVEHWRRTFSEDEERGYILRKDRISKFLEKVCFKLGASDGRTVVLHVPQEAFDDLFCVELVNPLEGNCEVKQVTALLSLIKSAWLSA